jgi:hypothetical protein
MKKTAVSFLMLMALLCSGIHAFAETITCKVLADVSIDEWYPDENLNYKDRLIVATNKNIHHGIARTLLFFDIPDNMTAADVKSAAVYLSPCAHCGGGNGGQIGFYALNQPFAEDNDTWNTLAGGSWDESAYAEAPLPSGIDWNPAIDGQPAADAQGMDVTELLTSNLDKVRQNGIMMRFVDEHQEPYTHQNIASRESQDPLDFAPLLAVQTGESSCPAELALKNNEETLSVLRHFRDRVLAKTPEGRSCIALYYRHAPEISRLLAADKDLTAKVNCSLRNLLPAFQKMNRIGTVAVTEPMRREIKKLREAFEEKAGHDLRNTIIRAAGSPGLQ